MDRGKILLEKDIEDLKGNWGRYIDKDSDGIPYRTLPGNQHPMSAYFTRGTGHDEHARYSEDSTVWVNMMNRLKKKNETAREYVPAPIVRETRGAEVGIVAYGSTEAAIEEARAQLAATGLKSSSMRVRAIPFSAEVRKFIARYEQIVVVEMNRDGQLYQLLCVDFPEYAAKFRSVAYQDGLPAAAKWVREGILANVKGNKKVAAKKAVKKKPAAKKKITKKTSTKKRAKK
jgi:2-oxoglutarate ferredoxin oxidoreductase subunit alpha